MKIYLLIILLFVSACSSSTKIKGEVFAVENGAAKKLPLVEVVMYREADIAKNIDDAIVAIDKADTAYDECTPKYDPKCTSERSIAIRDAMKLLAAHHTPVATEKSNSDGAFEFALPEGQYIVRANGDGMNWLFKVTARGTEQKLTLSRENAINFQAEKIAVQMLRFTPEN